VTNAAELKWRKAAAEESTTPSTDEIPAKLVALDSESEPMLKMTDALPIKLGVQQITLVMSTSRTVTRDVTRFIIGKTVSVCHFKQNQLDALGIIEPLGPPDGSSPITDAELLMSSVKQLMIKASVPLPSNISIVVQRVAGFINVSTLALSCTKLLYLWIACPRT